MEGFKRNLVQLRVQVVLLGLLVVYRRKLGGVLHLMIFNSIWIIQDPVKLKGLLRSFK